MDDFELHTFVAASIISTTVMICIKSSNNIIAIRAVHWLLALCCFKLLEGRCWTRSNVLQDDCTKTGTDFKLSA